MPNQDLKQVKSNLETLLNPVGAKTGEADYAPVKLFLALTQKIVTKEKYLIALSISCFSQALAEHYGCKFSPKNLILGDYCYAQGILAASQTGDIRIVKTLSQTIADIASSEKKGFSSMEEAASYLAGFLLGEDDLQGYRELGKLVKKGGTEAIELRLGEMGYDKGLVEFLEK